MAEISADLLEIYVVSTSLSAAMFRLVILIKTRPPGDERAHTRPLARCPLGILAAWRPCGAVFLHSADHGCGVSLYSGNVRHFGTSRTVTSSDNQNDCITRVLVRTRIHDHDMCDLIPGAWGRRAVDAIETFASPLRLIMPNFVAIR